MNTETITINGTEYVPVTDAPKTGDVTIVVLQRGWVVVGRLTRGETQCTLADAHVVRVWGTTKGLGEIALNGPTAKTVLDPCGVVHYHPLTEVLSIQCTQDKWPL